MLWRAGVGQRTILPINTELEVPCVFGAPFRVSGLQDADYSSDDGDLGVKLLNGRVVGVGRGRRDPLGTWYASR